MDLKLRPHHFLCLLGYKGNNYNKTQVNNWDKVSNYLKQNPDTDIVIISGRDNLCSNCPTKSGNKERCKEDNVSKIDEKVKNLLGLEEGKTYKYSEILKLLNEKMTIEKHEEFCKTCMWWLKGLCKNTFAPKNNSQVQPTQDDSKKLSLVA